MSDLRHASALCIGAGGLGSPAAYYLAAAGVGTLGIVDDDVVESSNLQRQILHSTDELGMPKAVTAARRLRARHPHLLVESHRTRFDLDNALELVRRYDLVVDGSDNFRTKFLANDAAVLAARPLVHGGILRWQGQLMVVIPGESACYRCLFESPPPPGEVPSCAEAGVIGALAGVLGSLMAAEAVKILSGEGRPLGGRVVTYDALQSRWREIEVRPNPDCAVCGTQATIRELRHEFYQSAECNLPAGTAH